MDNLVPPLPLTPELLALAERLIWFEPPAEAQADRARLMGSGEDHDAVAGIPIVKNTPSVP
ncbi:MAG: hypothetical protein HQM06_11970 [Magnetococcales bacterium]|nr:hypothetical protein [Magnetococcales bacterium]